MVHEILPEIGAVPKALLLWTCTFFTYNYSFPINLAPWLNARLLNNLFNQKSTHDNPYVIRVQVGIKLIFFFKSEMWHTKCLHVYLGTWQFHWLQYFSSIINSMRDITSSRDFSFKAFEPGEYVKALGFEIMNSFLYDNHFFLLCFVNVIFIILKDTHKSIHYSISPKHLYQTIQTSICFNFSKQR